MHKHVIVKVKHAHPQLSTPTVMLHTLATAWLTAACRPAEPEAAAIQTCVNCSCSKLVTACRASRLSPLHPSPHCSKSRSRVSRLH